MSIPKIAIVGRPNVGKSSLFNWITGQRIAIVDPTAGVTRDGVGFFYRMGDRCFELFDTGGMGIVDSDGLTADVEAQIDHALVAADQILFVLDAQSGLSPLDDLVARRLRAIGKPVMVVANKCDNDKIKSTSRAEVHRLGWDVVFTSCTHNLGREEFMAALAERLPGETDVAQDAAMKLAVVGKRNAGKSTFINQLVGDERMIVSEVPGTTRDSIDVRFDHGGRTFIAIDTAGVRKKTSLASGIEFYGFSRAQRTVRRADVVLHFIDSRVPVSKVDMQLAAFAAELYKPTILVVNKWDLAIELTDRKEYNRYLDDVFPMQKYSPRAYITAKTGKNVAKLVDSAWSLFQQSRGRVKTAELNRILREAVDKRSPPLRANRPVKFYYATQASVAPPVIVVFCNDRRLLDPTYQRYLLNVFRAKLPFPDVPIKLLFRRRDEGISDLEAKESRRADEFGEVKEIATDEARHELAPEEPDAIVETEETLGG
ncbi:MAG TPA: ribosome biogenesis GTPase Der [Planctomycetia bacterium]|nr:ribosome biogenesis GTPase Der [Planctomycetia bacterium]